MPKGAVYLENDKSERKATGSYYTPDHIVKYIVENAVGPVLNEKFETLRPKLRKAQSDKKAFDDRQKAFTKAGMKPEPESKADLIGRGLVDELFDVKVLDPAMGSGHFLVEAVDFVTDKALGFLNAFPWNPVSLHLAEMRREIMKEMDGLGITIDAGRLSDVNLLKRHILKRCVYGVDLNPMAVELAKVSLWLDCFTLGAPLSFLDHHIKCGNSLIGVTVDEVREAVEGGQGVLWGSQFTRLKLAAESMREVGDLSDLTSDQVRQSRKKFMEAYDLLAPYKRIMDVYTSQWFGNKPVKSKKGKRGTIQNPSIDFLKSDEAAKFVELNRRVELSAVTKDLVGTAVLASIQRGFFHWELEFPEVFFEKGMRKQGDGFDAVIGNPPYDVLAEKELGYDVSRDLKFFRAQNIYAPAVRGKSNLYKFFVCRGMKLMSSAGSFSFIVPMALLGDDQAAGVRRALLEQTGLVSIDAFPQKDDPRNRVFPEAKLSTAIFVTRSIAEGKNFLVRTNLGRFVDKLSPILFISSAEILSFDKTGVVIPSCGQRDWEIIVRILGLPTVKLFRAIAKSFQGEVNETNERERGSVTGDPADQLTIRGANICMYAIRDASQGEPVYLNVEEFLNGKKASSKAFDYLQDRVGFQRSSPQNNYRRIIAARMPKGNFCLDTISYVTESSCKISLDLVLAFLNSVLLDWFFRIVSTNSKVNEYQFDLLPVPTFASDNKTLDIEDFFNNRNWTGLAQCLQERLGEPGVLPSAVAGALTEMSRIIQDIEAERILKNRSERSKLSPESQPIQDAIDAVLFKCYGLSDDEAEYIKQRLREML